jgi:hypothetical protein
MTVQQTFTIAGLVVAAFLLASFCLVMAAAAELQCIQTGLCQ